MDETTAKGLLAGGVGLVLLRWHGWRALQFARPASAHVDVDTPEPVAPPRALQSLHDQLLALGFRALGTHVEQPKLGPATVLHDYAHEQHVTFASLFLSVDGRPRCYLLTPCEGGGLALTANHVRPSREAPGYVAGYLDGVGPERLLHAHLRRVTAVGRAEGPLTLAQRVACARRWYETVGQAELRHTNAVSLLWTLFALGMVGAALVTALR